MAIYNLGFVMEQAAGCVSHTRTLQLNSLSDAEVRTRWALIPRQQRSSNACSPAQNVDGGVQASLQARAAVSKMLRRCRVDAFLFHTQLPALLAAVHRRPIPRIVSVDATPQQHNQLEYAQGRIAGLTWFERAKWRLHRNCYSAATHLVAWSQSAKQSLITDYELPADKITVVPPGIDTGYWRRPTPRRPAEQPVKVLFVAPDFERAGGPLLLAAFRALRHLGAELHLVTQAPVASEPGVFVYSRLLPNSLELRELYHQADVFAVPTHVDYSPIVLAEAGAAGLPVVTSSLSIPSEFVREQQTGLLTPAGSDKAFEDALRRLILQPALRLELGERAVNHVCSTYEARKNTGRLLELLKGEVDIARMHMRVFA